MNLQPHLCIYHSGGCQDGFAVAWSIWRRWLDCNFAPGVYGQPLPDTAGLSVLFVDFSAKRDVLDVMAQTARSIVVIDHHKSALADLAPFVVGFNNGSILTPEAVPGMLRAWRRYRRERWLTPDGRTVVAALPSGVKGHFGPELRRFVLAQHHQSQVTVARLAAQLHSIGVAVSKRQVMRMLIDDKEVFLQEMRDVLRAGLETASWISVDDTGARHQGRNGTCTQIGNEHFAWFGTTSSKSRLNFLELLRAGHTDYVVNAEALAYMRQRALPRHAIARLADHPDKHFADEHSWTSHLQRLGFQELKQHSLDPPRLATEGALWGAIKYRLIAVERENCRTLACSGRQT